MDGSLVFTRWHQCALRCGHNGTTWRIRLNLCLFRPTEYTTKWQISRFSCFCTTHGRESLYFTIGDPFPQNCPFSWGDLDPIWFIIHDSLASPSPQSKQHLDRLSCFFTQVTAECPYTLQSDAPPPSKLPLPIRDLEWPQSNIWFPGPTQVLNPSGISIGSAVFAGLTSVTDKTGNSRPHLHT